MKIPQEIRSKISQLDDLANEISEFLLEHEDDEGFNEEALDLRVQLDDLCSGITNFQESQGWI